MFWSPQGQNMADAIRPVRLSELTYVHGTTQVRPGFGLKIERSPGLGIPGGGALEADILALHLLGIGRHLFR